MKINSINIWFPFTKLNNDFVFPDSKPPINNILYELSGICGQFGLCYFMFSFVTSSKLIILVSFYYTVTFNLFFFTY